METTYIKTQRITLDFGGRNIQNGKATFLKSFPERK